MVAALMLLLASAPPQALPAAGVADAELIFLNGKVGEADSLAVTRGRITFVGSRGALEGVMRTGTPKIIDLKGKRLLPGFHDSHVHWLGGGLQLARVELKDAATEAEFGKRLTAFDKQMPRDRWMLGGNWDHDRTFNGTLPTVAMLDKYAPNRPVFIRRYDGHMGVANSAALKLANITPATADPAGGVVYRLADGKTPSGVLKDNAMDLVEKVIPDPADDEIAEAVRASMREAARFGVTSVQDMEGTSPAGRRKLMRILQNLDRRGELTCRIDVRWPISLHKELAQLGVEANFGGDFVRIGGVKGFMDGSLGSATAKMFDPYFLDPKNTGVYVTEPAAMRSLVRNADAAGLSVAIHAIGDRANSDLFDVFAEAAKANGPRDRRFRIEHAQHLRPQDYRRFKELDVVASMQPYHVVDDGRWAALRIGETRCKSSYAYRSVLDAGGKLAFGSDWPVAPLDPMTGIAAAVTRQTLDGKHPNGWYPEQRLTAAEAIAAYTAGSAYAAGQEKERGTLEVGKLADFVVLSSDPIAVPAGGVFDWAGCKVEMTIVGGKVVYDERK